MSKVSISISCFILVFFVANVAIAMPVWQTNPPGQPPTTYQKWTFDDADNPALPEFFSNQYGIPMAELSTTQVPPDHFGWLDVVDGRQGVWAGEPLIITLTIPNRPISDEYKEIWLEMDFQPMLEWINVTPNPVCGSVVEIYRDISLVDSQWKKLIIGWRIEPNPSEETICISVMGTGGFVDYITVDTVCVPEPATLALLGLGTLVLLKGKRK